jgi:hypothetical protein
MHSLLNRTSGSADSATLPRPVFAGEAMASESRLRPCFGVGCLHHRRCARYAAVVDSQANPETLGTCVSGDTYPLFVEASACRGAAVVA